MLYWVIFDSGRKLQFIGIWGYHFNDFVRTNAAVIEFAAWSLCCNILGIKPNLVTFLECRCWLTSAVSILLLTVLCTDVTDMKARTMSLAHRRVMKTTFEPLKGQY